MTMDHGIEHSTQADQLKDRFTLWVKIKDRYDSNYTSFNQLKIIAEWLRDQNIKSELNHRNKWQFNHPIITVSSRTMQFANRFYIAIFPKTIEQWVATKIQWDKYLSERTFNVVA